MSEYRENEKNEISSHIIDGSSTTVSDKKRNKRADNYESTINQMKITISNILNEFPQAFQSNAKKLKIDKFEPELEKNERLLIKKKQNRLALLENYYQQLNNYESNLALLRNDKNLWIGEMPTPQEEPKTSEHVVNTSERYLSILDSIEVSCDQILELSNQCRKAMVDSRDKQDKLYDQYEAWKDQITHSHGNQSSSNTAPNPSNPTVVKPTPSNPVGTSSSSIVVPKDTRDILKSLPKLMK